MDENEPTNDRQSPDQGQSKPTYSKNYNSVDYDYHKDKHTKRNILIALCILLLAIGGGAAYWFFVREKPAQNTAANKPASQQAQSEPVSAIAEETKNHNSKNFSLSFDYPKDWNVVDEESGEKLTATSPAMQLTGADNQKVTGQIVLTFRKQGQPLGEFDAGNALAIRDSEKVAYTAPSPGQRGSTYLSFLAYANAANPAALDGVYVTGDSGYQKGQAVPLVDISKVNPVITLTFQSCTDGACSDASPPLAIANSMWDAAVFSGPLKKMLESLVVN